VARVDGSLYDHTLPLLKLQFATTLPPIVPLTDDDYQELYEAEEQFGKPSSRQCCVGFDILAVAMWWLDAWAAKTAVV